MGTIKEALYIRVNDPSLNRNVGKYHLLHVWDEVLFNTSELKLKKLTLWFFHLPLAITSATTQPPCSCFNICHLAITSAILVLQLVV